MNTEKFDSWVILEVFGHRRLAGHATEATILGGALLRLDIPTDDGKYITQYIGPGSIFSMTPTTEDVARAIAADNQPEPVGLWEVQRLLKNHQLPMPEVPTQSCTAFPEWPGSDDPGDEPGGSDFKRDGEFYPTEPHDEEDIPG